MAPYAEHITCVIKAGQIVQGTAAQGG